MTTFEKILSAPAVAGMTKYKTSLLKQELENLFDTCKEDALGSLYFTKTIGDGAHLLLAAGLDTSGLVATCKEGEKINVTSLGSFNTANMAFSRVCFEKARGVLVPLGNYDCSAEITDYAVETFDKEAVDLVNLGDTAYFDEPVTQNKNGMYTGFGAGVKMCGCFLCDIAKSLLNDASLLSTLGIGKVTVAFLGQESLGFRGASVAFCDASPDFAINICPIDMTEKNVGSLDFSDGVALKMIDCGFVADESLTQMAEKILDSLGICHKRRVSNKERSALSRLTLSKEGIKGAEICLPVKFTGTRGETVKNPFYKEN